MSQTTPIHALAHLAANSTLPGIEGIITKLYERNKGTNNQGNPWSFQAAEFQGSDGHTCRIKFDNFDPVGPNWCNVPVRFLASTDPRAKSLVVEEYQGKKSVKIRSNSQIEWNAQFQMAPAQSGPPSQQQPSQGPPPAQGPPQTAHHGPPQGGGYNQPPTTQQGPPAQRQAPPQQQQAPQDNRPMPLNGQMVGMAIGKAVELMMHYGVPDPFAVGFTQDLYRLASDIVRVSQKMQDGHLAPSPSARAERAAAKLAAEAKQTKVEPDYEHQPPPNSQQSGQMQQAFKGGSLPGEEDDEIPF